MKFNNLFIIVLFIVGIIFKASLNFFVEMDIMLQSQCNEVSLIWDIFTVFFDIF